jgi:CRISPR-associated protein Csm4
MNRIYHLNFTTPVHFGLEGIGQERIDDVVHSDTLWGAIIDKWLLLYADDPAELCCRTSFTLSSAFPLIEGTRFFPVPMGVMNKVMDDVAHLEAGTIPLELKDIKKIRYIEEKLFFRILAGGETQLADLTLSSVHPHPLAAREQAKQSGGYAIEAQRPRIAVDQINGGVREGAFFYSSDQFFGTESGLFFFASFPSQQIREKFEAALRLLGDCGLGADRTVGRGAFSVTASDWSINKLKDPIAQVLLSLYFPTPEEVAQGVLTTPVSAYGLTRRTGHAGGRDVSRFRRADCWMLTEGSVLPFAPEGDNPKVLTRSDVIPHDVYRCGRAFCLPMVNRRMQ